MKKENVIELLKINNGYIKGHGSNTCRLMDFSHSPIANIKKNIVQELLEEQIIVKENLIYKLK
jgi:hypothetical protein